MQTQAFLDINPDVLQKQSFSPEPQLSRVSGLIPPTPPNWDTVDSLHLFKFFSIFAFLMRSLVANVLSHSSGSHKSDLKAGVFNFGQATDDGAASGAFLYVSPHIQSINISSSTDIVDVKTCG